jgi:deoxyribodipyrimidine photo-lyase
MSGSATVVWFRRDLRLHDHPALTEAVLGGNPVAPLFVVDPRLLDGRFASANRAWFLAGALADLAASLAERGASLTVRTGDPATVIPAFAREVGAAAVAVSRDYTPFGRARDRRVADALATAGIAFRPKRGALVHEPEEVATGSGSPFQVFTPFLRAWERRPFRAVLPAPDRILGIDRAVGPPDLGALAGNVPTADPALLPPPGERAARDRLARWLATGPTNYARERDSLATPGTSRLSQDLRFGCLSPVEVATRSLATDGGTEGSRRYVSELAWRDFYAHALWHEPRIAREPFVTRYRTLAWPEPAPGAVEAWRAGRTGYPVVDAAMRQLAATGWMPNRARMIAASFLVKDLLVDWRVGEAHFMAHLVDGDPASNLGGWQWAASVGTDAQPYVRVFNPVTQGRRFDPDGAYVRRWIGELANVPTARVHEPWTMDDDAQLAAACRIGTDYPAPIVDHAEARRRAIEFFRA